MRLLTENICSFHNFTRVCYFIRMNEIQWMNEWMNENILDNADSAMSFRQVDGIGLLSLPFLWRDKGFQ